MRLEEINSGRIAKYLMLKCIQFHLFTPLISKLKEPGKNYAPGVNRRATYAPGVNMRATAPPLQSESYMHQSREGNGDAQFGPSQTRIQNIVELHMTRQFTSSWSKQKLGSKAVLFLLDASGSMAGSRLRICKESIQNILENFISDDDFVGFMAFASYTRVLFDMMVKKGKLKFMLERLHQLEVFGGTKFYDATLEAVQILEKVERDSK